MDRPSALLLRLDLETHAYHRDADLPWLALVSPDVTRAQYADQLARAYSIEAPLEAALVYTPHVATMMGRRTRSRLLAQDLFALDYPMARIVPRLIAPFPSMAEALGWLYAIERSARLFEIVRRNVLARLPDVANATWYITDAYAQQRWQDLGEMLDRVARAPHVADRVIHAAHDAFRCALDWYVGDQALRHGA